MPLLAQASIGSVELQHWRRLASAEEIAPRRSFTQAFVRFALTETALLPRTSRLVSAKEPCVTGNVGS
ncbi:hypothetical protein C5Y44_04515 [Corynebacterium sp. J010B-136]|nr:hypothetical protein C5Y44_04515 [Corynebacterium sp. J010B-136]